MEQMLALSLLVLHGARAAALPAPQGTVQFHEDLSTGKPLKMIVGQDLKRMLLETDHQDQERHERHDSSKPKPFMLEQVVEEVLQDPDDAELRKAVTQLIKEVENRHAKKHKTTETDIHDEDILVKSAADDQLDDKNEKIDTHDNAPSQTNHNNNLAMAPKPNSDDIHSVSRNGLKQGHNDVKQNDVKHNSNGKHVNVSDSNVANSDSHGSQVLLAINGKTVSESTELLYSLNRLSNLSEDLNETIVDQQVEQDTPTNADLRDGEQKIEKTVIFRSNEDPVSFASWGSDDYGDQYLSHDDEYDDLIDLRESKESIRFVESAEDGSYLNPTNNENVLDHIISYNDKDINVKDDNNNEVETIINKETPQHDLNSNALVTINDLLYNDILNAVEAGTSALNSYNDLNHVLKADTPTSINNNSHANDSLRAETPTESYTTEPETSTTSDLRLVESGEIERDTNESHHHRHSKENGDSSVESNHAVENNYRGCRVHNKIYNLSFQF